MIRLKSTRGAPGAAGTVTIKVCINQPGSVFDHEINVNIRGDIDQGMMVSVAAMCLHVTCLVNDNGFEKTLEDIMRDSMKCRVRRWHQED